MEAGASGSQSTGRSHNGWVPETLGRSLGFAPGSWRQHLGVLGRGGLTWPLFSRSNLGGAPGWKAAYRKGRGGSRETACGSHGPKVARARTRKAAWGAGFRRATADEGLDVRGQAGAKGAAEPGRPAGARGEGGLPRSAGVLFPFTSRTWAGSYFLSREACETRSGRAGATGPSTQRLGERRALQTRERAWDAREAVGTLQSPVHSAAPPGAPAGGKVLPEGREDHCA